MKKEYLKNAIIAGVLCVELMTSSSAVLANSNSGEENPNPVETGLGVLKIEDTTDELFGDLSEDTKVLELPAGGFVSGSGNIEISDLDGNIIEIYNVDTDPNSISVKEAKEKIFKDGLESMNDESLISPYSGYPPTKTMTLSIGQKYTSNPFNASTLGWRYAGYKFIPKSGTGQYLRWGTFNDSGRVFSAGYNPWQGIEVYPGKYYWYGYDHMASTYATHNPIQGTYYNVANVEP